MSLNLRTDTNAQWLGSGYPEMVHNITNTETVTVWQFAFHGPMPQYIFFWYRLCLYIGKKNDG